jgi:hypothetical protein
VPLHLVATGDLHGKPVFDVYAGAIRIGAIRIGAIRRITGSDQRVCWSWLFSLSAYPPDFKTTGSTFELEHAMRAFKREWIVWLRSLRKRRR